MNPRLIAAGLAGFLAIVFGAFGAHALPGSIPEIQRSAFETGGQFHLAHALLLAALALGPRSARLGWSFAVIFLGTALFSGALYVYGLTGEGRAAMLAPVGGTTLMIGWLLIASAGVRFGAAPNKGNL